MDAACCCCHTLSLSGVCEQQHAGSMRLCGLQLAGSKVSWLVHVLGWAFRCMAPSGMALLCAESVVGQSQQASCRSTWVAAVQFLAVSPRMLCCWLLPPAGLLGLLGPCNGTMGSSQS
jgi:hypothetical protein